MSIDEMYGEIIDLEIEQFLLGENYTYLYSMKDLHNKIFSSRMSIDEVCPICESKKNMTVEETMDMAEEKIIEYSKELDKVINMNADIGVRVAKLRKLIESSTRSCEIAGSQKK